MRGVFAVFTIGLAMVASAEESGSFDVLVGLTAGSSPERMPLGVEVVERLEALNVWRLRIDDERALSRLRTDPNVRYVETNFRRTLDALPNDPRFSGQTALSRIACPPAWDVARGNPAVTIAILDTGVDLDHPDLAPSLLPGYDFVGESLAIQDRIGHGTHCAGIAAAATNNGLGVAGVAWGCKILPVKVIGDDGSGTDDDIAAGIVWAVDQGAKVISMSFGGPDAGQTLAAAVAYATDHGVLVVCSAGNAGTTAPVYPAFYLSSLAVSAVDAQDRRASFSNYGNWVELAAPGVEILSTLPGGSYDRRSGTSMAAPFVAGAAALLFSQLGSGATLAKVRARLESNAIAVPGRFVTKGRLDVLRALTNATGTATRRDFRPSEAGLDTGSGTVEPELLAHADRRRVDVASIQDGTTQAIDWWASIPVTWTDYFATLEVKIVASATRAGTLGAWLYDWRADTWRNVGALSLTNADSTRTLKIDNPGRFASPEGRIEFYATADRASAFRLRVDQLSITTVSR
ncbi:MAG TPA: S8 family peptidase [Fimbriimonadaceae bacterium]|nr:S8 family peptidase [Fimbriimonadaceae bacterium]